jgi:hypothetical protein
LGQFFKGDGYSIEYEIIAFPFSIITTFFIVGNVELEEISDPVLYTHFFYKTTTFENLIKGIPADKNSVLRREIEVYPPKSVPYSETFIKNRN